MILFLNAYFVINSIIKITLEYGFGTQLNGFATSCLTRWWLVFPARANSLGNMTAETKRHCFMKRKGSVARWASFSSMPLAKASTLTVIKDHFNSSMPFGRYRAQSIKHKKVFFALLILERVFLLHSSIFQNYTLRLVPQCCEHLSSKLKFQNT